MIRYLYRVNGPDVRFMAVLLLMAEAVGYAHVLWSGVGYTTSYLIQSALMPLWIYAVILCATGAGLMLTINHRRTWFARTIAGVGFVLQGGICFTYWLSGGYTGFWWGLVVVWALGIESIWTKHRDI